MTPIEIFFAAISLLSPIAMEISRRSAAAVREEMKKLHEENKDLRGVNDMLWKNLHGLEKRVLEHYVRKDDFRESLKEIKEAVAALGQDIKKDIGKLEAQFELFRQEGG